ncbi:MAG: hypothetical protein ACNA8W_01320, partial [Bradymonadaceae bacterium]
MWTPKKILLLPAILAALAACGPETSERWDQPLQISAPLTLGDDLVYLNQTFEQLQVVRPVTRSGEVELETLNLPTGKTPTKMAKADDDSAVYLINEGDRTLSVFDMTAAEPVRSDVRLDSPYDVITVDPEGEYILLGFSGATNQRIIARNLNEIGIVDMRGGVPEEARFVTLFSRAQNIHFAPPFSLGGQDQRLAVSLAPSEITIIDLNEDDELNSLRAVPLTISQADAIKNPVAAVFDVTPNPSAPNTVSLYVLTDRGEDITQIVIQPSVREDSPRKFDISVNQLAAGQTPGQMAVLDLPAGTRLLTLDRERPRFTLVDVASGEGATFDLPLTSAATKLIVYRAQVLGEDRVETRVLAYSERSPLLAVIRPESIAVSGDTPTVGRTVEAIRAKAAPSLVRMDDATEQDRAIAFHQGSQDGFTVLNLRTNRAIPIQGEALRDIIFDGARGFGVFTNSPHFVHFDLETGHPTVFDLPEAGRRIFLSQDRTRVIVEHSHR